MNKRQPLSPEAEEAINEALRKACERMERAKAAAPKGVLAELAQEPREA